MTSLHDLLETTARAIREKAAVPTAEATPASVLELQIAFWSEALDQTRAHHRDLLRSILRAECYVGTDLMQLDSYAPAKIWHHRFDARDNLKNKLLQLDAERRRLAATHDRDVRDVRARLLDLLVQHAFLRD